MFHLNFYIKSLQTSTKYTENPWQIIVFFSTSLEAERPLFIYEDGNLQKVKKENEQKSKDNTRTRGNELATFSYSFSSGLCAVSHDQTQTGQQRTQLDTLQCGKLMTNFQSDERPFSSSLNLNLLRLRLFRLTVIDNLIFLMALPLETSTQQCRESDDENCELTPDLKS